MTPKWLGERSLEHDATARFLGAVVRPVVAHVMSPGWLVHAMGLSSAASGAVAERVAVLDSRPTKSTKAVAPIASKRVVSGMFLSRLATPPGATPYAATTAVRPIAALARVPFKLRQNLPATSAASPIAQPATAIHEGFPASIVANTRL